MPRTTRRIGTLLGLLLLLPSSRCLAETPPAPQKVTTIEGITEYRLDNGLRLLLFPDPSTSTVTVNLTVFVGSRHEGYGETGMAHLLEHMVFKGTPTHRDVPRALKEHGASFNGTTWVDRTNYFETMEGTDANLEFGIRLEADRLINSLIRREDLLSEMTVVRNEFEAGENSPSSILSQRMMAVAYEWHNYGKSTIGNRSDIERVPVDNLRTFYRKYYQPDNAMLIVAGKFDPAKALSLVGKYFGALKRPARKLDDTYTEEPPQDGERTVVLRRVGKVGVVGAVYHIPAGAHPDYPAVEVLENILTSEPSGRLYKALVETHKATSVSASAFAWHDPGVLEIMAQVDRSKPLPDVQNTLVETLESLHAEPITPEEVERAKRRILKNRDLLVIRSNRVGVELSEWAAQGDWRLFFLHRDRVAKVTPADVSRVVTAYLKRSNRTVGLYIPGTQPERAAIPAAPPVAELVKNYQGTQTIAAGEAFEPTPENIEKHVRRSQLPAGLKMAFLPKKTRGEAVTLHLTLRFGNEESLKGHERAAQFLGPLMTRGTRKHNRQQIQDELDRLGARLMAHSSLGEVSVTIQAKRAKLPAVLELLGEILREPTFPADQFDILKRQERDSLEKGRTEPFALAFRELERRLNPYPKEDIRYVPTIEESLARLEATTVDEVRRLYTDQLSAQAGELAVVGDFDPQQVQQSLRARIGDWKASIPYRRIARPARTDVRGGQQEILTPDKANALYLAGAVLPLSDADPDYPALRVANFLFGGGSLSSRLANRVRQKEGLSYGIASMFSADSLDKSARLTIYAITNPANMGKVNAAIVEELNKLLKDGVRAEEVNEAKAAYLKQRKLRRSNDGALAGLLTEALFNGRTLAYQAEFERQTAALTAEAVMAAVRKHWTPDKLVIIQAGDFAKGPASQPGTGAGGAPKRP
jgi:zinc protease